MSLKKNVGEKDRMYRAIAGAVIIMWGIAHGNALGLIGFILFATAWFRVCPLYIPMDVDTTK